MTSPSSTRRDSRSGRPALVGLVLAGAWGLAALADPAAAQPRLPEELFFHGPGWATGTSPVQCLDAVPAPSGSQEAASGTIGSVRFETDHVSDPPIRGGCIFLPDLPAVLPAGNFEIYLFNALVSSGSLRAELEVVNPVTGAFQVGEPVTEPIQPRWNRLIIRVPTPVTVPSGGFLRVSLSAISGGMLAILDAIRPPTTNLQGPQGLSGVVIRPDDRVVDVEPTPTQTDCRFGARPAATLLFPYFEVDLDDVDGRTTLVAVENANDTCTLARVTLWTDFGVPTLTFYIFLAEDDLQTVNLRDVFNGALPDTSHVLGSGGCPTLGFDICQAQDLSPSLTQRQINSLRADHLGQPNPITGDCAGSSRGNSVAVGYATVDSVFRCDYSPTVETWTRSEWQAPGGYFVATDTAPGNWLLGDWFRVDTGEDFAQGESAVHVVADPDRFGPGDYTFYGRYVSFDGSDARAPLSGVWDTRFLAGGLFSGGTDLLVWRDNRSPEIRPVACGDPPSWAPLGQRALRVWDEDGLPFQPPGGRPLPRSTQRVSVGPAGFPVPVPFGRLELDLWHDASTPAQAWVTPVMSALGRFSVGQTAARLDDLCQVEP